MIIYRVTNKLDGKTYIGCTVKSLDARRACHLSTAKRSNATYFHRAINLHGQDNFSWDIVETCNGREELLLAEKKWIRDTTPEYNLTRGGEGSIGRTLSEETRKKIAMSRMGVPPANKGKPSPFRGVKLSPRSEETKRKISENRRGKPAWNTGIPWSKEVKDKISKRAKDRLQYRDVEKTREHMRRMQECRKPLSEEARRLKSEMKIGAKRDRLGRFVKEDV